MSIKQASEVYRVDFGMFDMDLINITEKWGGLDDVDVAQ